MSLFEQLSLDIIANLIDYLPYLQISFDKDRTIHVSYHTSRFKERYDVTAYYSIICLSCRRVLESAVFETHIVVYALNVITHQLDVMYEELESFSEYVISKQDEILYNTPLGLKKTYRIVPRDCHLNDCILVRRFPVRFIR